NDASYGCAFTTRGNATSTITYGDPVTPANGITKALTYNSLGDLVTAQLNCCQLQQFSYSTATQYAFPDSMTKGASGGPQLTTSPTYNAYTGQVATSTDENGKVTSFSYDLLKRPTTTTRPDNTQIVVGYDDSGHTVTVTSPITASSGQK